MCNLQARGVMCNLQARGEKCIIQDSGEDTSPKDSGDIWKLNVLAVKLTIQAMCFILMTRTRNEHVYITSLSE